MLKRNPFKKSGLAWLVLCLGLLGSVFASFQVKQSIEQQAIRQFAFVCDQITLKIQESLNAYALILRGGSGLFSASNEVTRQDWRAYVETLRADKSVQGILGIGFSVLIQPDQLDQHIARIRQQGFPDYTVNPPGERAVYSSIIYLEPFTERNLRAFGYDMYSEPVRRAAASWMIGKLKPECRSIWKFMTAWISSLKHCCLTTMLYIPRALNVRCSSNGKSN